MLCSRIDSKLNLYKLTIVIALLAIIPLPLGCGSVGIVGNGEDEVWDDDAEEEPGERQTQFKHPPPPGPAPWTYVLTDFGGPSDKGVYMQPVACGGKRPDGNWWYSTGAWSFGCNSRLEVRANGQCAVVKVVDNGPAAWVESKAKSKCGGHGYVLDVSPLVVKHLFNMSHTGWSECRKIEVRQVASNTPTGPCSGGSGGWNPNQPGGNNGCHTGVPFGWGYCSSSCPCGAGQGDCDKDSDCQQGLHCAHNTGSKYGAGSTVDVCEPNNNSWSPQPGGNCHNGSLFSWEYCSSNCPCGVGQGDCDNDSHCQPGLRCAKDVGSKYGLKSTIDICENQGSSPNPYNPYQPPSSGGGSCSWNNGKNYRRCMGCGTQWCLSNGTWSNKCEPRPDIFPCPGGRYCGPDGQCH